MKAWKNDLAAAGIEYGDAAVGYADLHAQRKTLSTMLAVAGVSQRVRQAHMRHTDPRLTDVTYMDETLLPIAAEIGSLPAIPSPTDEEQETIPLQSTGTDGRLSFGAPVAGLMQENFGSEGQNEAWEGSVGQLANVMAFTDHFIEDEAQTQWGQGFGTQQQNPAPCGTGLDDQRVMGFEPTTFTLAT